jgi:serine/threonine protein kinase
MQKHTFTAFNTTFVVDSEYEFVKELGQGTYGSVIAVKLKHTGKKCAVKKIPNISTKVSVCYFCSLITGVGQPQSFDTSPSLSVIIVA